MAPPHNKLKTLEEISLLSFCELIYSECKAIQEHCKFCWELENERSAISKAVQKMKDYLLSVIPPIIWPDFYKTVLRVHERSRTLDDRMFFCSFMNDTVNVKNLKVGYRGVSSWPAVPWLMQEHHILANLRELDLTDLDFPEMIPEICSHCINLEVVTLPNVHQNEMVVESVIESCRKLRRIQGDFDGCKELWRLSRHALELLGELESVNWPIPGTLLVNRPRVRKLKLRSLWLVVCRQGIPHEINAVINTCPDLDSITINFYYSNNEGNKLLFNALAGSDLKLDSLTLESLPFQTVTFVDFFRSKGSCLTELTVDKCNLGNCLEFLENISEGCPNLTKLEILRYRPATNDVLNEYFTLTYRTPFPKLRQLRIEDYYGNERARGLVMAHQCLSEAPNLTTLTLILRNAMYSETLLSRLFDNEAVKRLTDLHLSCRELKMTEGFTRKLNETCSELMRLKIEDLTDEARIYLKGVVSDAKYKNLDFKAEFNSHVF